ncbi:AI-2E family transporter [Acinetobacter indicus]
MESSFEGINQVEQEKGVQNVKVVGLEQSPSDAMEWGSKILSPIATIGIVFLFVVLILISRKDLHDRLLRLLGGNLNIGTDVLDEAGQRIGTYLRMQLLVNVTYGIPMAAGLWFIGVPAAIMWGMLAVVLRFVPYVGPIISAVFPLTLAFAVDPGWNMFLWTLGLILLLELISNNVIEPVVIWRKYRPDYLVDYSGCHLLDLNLGTNWSDFINTVNGLFAGAVALYSGVGLCQSVNWQCPGAVTARTFLSAFGGR